MEENQQEQRRIASQAFEQSLEQLQNILQEDENEEDRDTEAVDDATNNKQVAGDSDSSGIDLEAWEHAVADIEQYLENKKKNK